MEEWKIIEEYDNYSVSNIGRVRNDKFNRILTPSVNSSGYYHVRLCKNGKAKTERIHPLVAKYFCENHNEYDEVDHIDRNTKNNIYTNLRFCTRSENIRNRRKQTNCSSQYVGVHKHQNKWRAQITINGKHNHIGSFETEEEAHEAFKNEVIANGLEAFYDF